MGVANIRKKTKTRKMINIKKIEQRIDNMILLAQTLLVFGIISTISLGIYTDFKLNLFVGLIPFLICITIIFYLIFKINKLKEMIEK